MLVKINFFENLINKRFDRDLLDLLIVFRTVFLSASVAAIESSHLLIIVGICAQEVLQKAYREVNGITFLDVL